MYELEDYEVLASAPYAARLNAPTPWSTRMMPHHRNMVRSQCRVLESRGAVTARHVLTVRLSPAPGMDEALRRSVGELAQTVWLQPGLVGLHLLRHETPPLAATTEQKIRGNGDRVADWILVVCGYDLSELRRLGEKEIDQSTLKELGAADDTERHLYSLAFSATPADHS